jgi:HupE / UreJ protein
MKLPFALTKLLTVAFAVLGPALLSAHDIPNDVTVRAFVKPQGQQLHVLVRVPLKAMRDIEFPARGPGYLDFERAEPLLHDAATLWLADALSFYEDGELLGKPETREPRLSLESDKSFASYETAVRRIAGPKLPRETNVVWNQTYLDVQFDYKIRNADAKFSLEPKLARLGLRVVTALGFVLPNDGVRAFEFTGDPGLVHLDPRWTQAAARFIELGFRHILDGTDHLLFLLCLVIPVRRIRPLIGIVTAFTVAHSITLIASAYDMAPSALWFPPLVETLIAVSIVFMALENIVRAMPEAHVSTGVLRIPRWMLAFGFGLVHGFGFSFALRETLQFAGSHMLASLLSFNIGVELGQVLVLLVSVPLLGLLFRYGVAERIGTIIVSAFIAHSGWHWMTDRGSQLGRFRFAWPEINAAFLASTARVMLVLVIAAGCFWLVNHVLGQRVAEIRSGTREEESQRRS